MKARWLPKTAVAVTAAGLIVFTLADPDGLIARENVQRFEETGKLDVAYMSGLSADAVPYLLDLPEAQLTCIVPRFDYRLGFEEPWTSANIGRARARALLSDTRDFDLSACTTDPQAYTDLDIYERSVP